jgi:hypothetical protein
VRPSYELSLISDLLLRTAQRAGTCGASGAPMQRS